MRQRERNSAKAHNTSARGLNVISSLDSVPDFIADLVELTPPGPYRAGRMPFADRPPITRFELALIGPKLEHGHIARLFVPVVIEVGAGLHTVPSVVRMARKQKVRVLRISKLPARLNHVFCDRATAAIPMRVSDLERLRVPHAPI
jgi:hypothetical protein